MAVGQKPFTEIILGKKSPRKRKNHRRIQHNSRYFPIHEYMGPEMFNFLFLCISGVDIFMGRIFQNSLEWPGLARLRSARLGSASQRTTQSRCLV